MKYLILTSYSIEGLEKIVNEHLDKDYVLSGSLIITPNIGAGDRDVYIQVVVKP